MTLLDVQAFVAIVETGSVVAAAAKLHLTQPAVTRRMQNLELSLGEQLLDRNSKPPKPTPSGQRAYTLARRLLASADDLKHSSGSGVGAGEFRFGATPRMTELGLVNAVARLRKTYPKLVLHASAAWSSALWEQILAGTLDAAAVSVPTDFTPPTGVTADRLGVLSGCVVAARDDALPATASLSDLGGRAWILNNDGCRMREILKDALKTRGLPFEVAVEATGADLQLELVAKGAGLGLVTEEMLHKSPHRKALRTIKLRDFKPKLEVCLVFRPGSHRLQGPLECLRESLAESLAAAF